VSFYYQNFSVASMYGALLIVVIFGTAATTAVGWLERRIVEQRR
jgi:ABC-type nitrate/sulfonate/bicarbonate transport system permease component